jgi:hypothetical protein
MQSHTTPAERQGSGQMGRAIIAGFVALGVSTVALVIFSGLAGSLGEVYRDRGFLFEWMYQLTHNEIVERGRGQVFASLAVHLFFGMLWALLYALVFEPRLREYPGWLSGALFAMLPFFLSVVVFLPMTGGGLFGSELGAGPLPLIGNLILHLIYGATLGAGYAADRYAPMDFTEDGPADQAAQRATMRRAESGAATGILIGAGVGGLTGVVLGYLLPFSSGAALVGSWPVALGVAGALAGGAVGALIGSMTGLTEPEAVDREHAAPSGGQPVSAALLPLGVIALVATLIVSIGSLLLTVAGSDPHAAREAGQYFYLWPIVVGLGILTLIVGGAAALDMLLPRAEEEHH